MWPIAESLSMERSLCCRVCCSVVLFLDGSFLRDFLKYTFAVQEFEKVYCWHHCIATFGNIGFVGGRRVPFPFKRYSASNFV
jgi:hypothetical protein